MIEMAVSFEMKSKAFGRGVIGLKHISLLGSCIPIYEYIEFKPFHRFHALSHLDMWERLRGTLISFFNCEDISLCAHNIPSLDDIIRDELLERNDASHEDLWRGIEQHLEQGAGQGFAFAQKLLSDYHSRIRDDGCGGNIQKSLKWFAEAVKVGIVYTYQGYEIMDEDEYCIDDWPLFNSPDDNLSPSCSAASDE